MSSCGFFAGNMIDIRACDPKPALFRGQATNARTAVLNGRKVVCVGGMAEVQGAGGYDGIAETLRIKDIGEYYHEEEGRGRLKQGKVRTAVLVGQTQSNMSAPRAIDTTRSSG